MELKTNAPLVAIATPVYNGARFLEEALESVQRQDYPNLVHIVIDNASTDATPEILARYRTARVPVVVHRNPTLLPMAANWNRAIEHVPADAQYFHLLCADDVMAPNAISRRVSIAEQDPEIGLVLCLWRGEGGLCGEEIPRDREVFEGPELMRSYFRREHSGLSGMFGLVRTSRIDRERPYYDPSFVIGLDTDANLRVARNSKVGFVHEELILWRQHEGSNTATTLTADLHIAFDWLVMLDRYGPAVMGYRDYLECRRAWRRYYLRRLLILRFKQKERFLFGWHCKALAARDDAAGVVDFIDALADWGLLVATGRRNSVGAPQRPAFGAPELLPRPKRPTA